MPDMEPNEIIDKATEEARTVVHKARDVAQEVIATAEVKAEELQEQTLTQIQQALRNDFIAHAHEDAKTAKKFTEAFEVTDENFKTLHKRLDNTATKEDIKEMMAFMKQIKIVVGGFSFTWNNASKIGAFILLILGFMLAIKYFFAAIFTSFLPK